MPAARSSLRRRVGLAAGAVVLLLVVLVVLALPFRGVRADADLAQSELTLAGDALEAGDVDAAATHVVLARQAVDDLRDATEGIGGRVWSLVPVAGTGVRDVRRLGTALDEVTAAVELATGVYPQLSGGDATLFRGEGGVDLPTLDRLIDAVTSVDGHLTAARAALDAVGGGAPVIGEATATARDRALGEIAPVQRAVRDLRPVLDALPAILGGDGPRTYLVAMLNPAEMRFSGGAALTFATATLDDGRLTLGRTNDTAATARAFRPVIWEGVEGNPFHSPFRQRITNANLAPSWPVSGEEVLRAWARLKRTDVDGLLAVDVVALARLVGLTGPLDVPGHGQVDADELVELTVGSYDVFGADELQRRKALNRALIPAFTGQLFGGVDAPGTVRALADSARARHLALHLRDPEAQRAVGDAGLDGDLSDTDGDYLGVFTQNVGGTKSDYWQRKTISSDVRLAGDGSARVRLKATIHNDAPPADPAAEADLYTRRTIPLNIGAFLPRGAAVRSLRWRDEDVVPEPRDYFGRPYLQLPALLEPGRTVTLSVVYDVPRAAILDGGGLTYRLDLDNHPTVRPEELAVTVHWPDGYASSELPDGWAATDGGARFDTAELDGRQRWRLRATTS